MKAQLLHYRNGIFEAIHEIVSGSCEVGRDPSCDISIDSPTLSRNHFSLTIEEDGKVKLRDRDAENGTYVDGVREYVRLLTSRATIQAGNEMFLFMPSDREDGEPSEVETAGEGDDVSESTEPESPVATSGVAPVLLRRMQAEMRIRVRPHFILREEGKSEQVFPIGPGVTPIGFGSLKISLGPSKKSTPIILAEVVAGPNGRFEVRSKALFSRIRINGKSRAKASMKPGDELLIDSQILVFHPGLDY